MINKLSICWLCWKPMMKKWWKCTKYPSAQILHNYLPRIPWFPQIWFFFRPLNGTDLKSEYLTSFTYLRYHFKIDSSCKMKLQCTARILIDNHYFDVLCLSFNVSFIHIIGGYVPQPMTWYHVYWYRMIWSQKESFHVILCHAAIICLIFTTHHWSNLLAFYLAHIAPMLDI